MASVNKVILVGNLGRDPEVRATPSGVKVASFSIATSEKFKDKNQVQKEETEWHNIVAWNRLAEIIEQYVKKGSSVYIEGKLKTRSWQDDQGVTKYRTEIIANQLQMLGGKSDSQSSGQTGGGYQSQGNQSSGYQQAPQGNQGNQGNQRDGYQQPQQAPSYDNSFNDEDLPF